MLNLPNTRISRTLAMLLASVAVFALGCANKVAPTGGPRDSIPAKVVLVEPLSGTTSFAASEIRFGFDDYVDRGIRNAISVLPTKRFTSAYAGDEIAISFREPLDSATTYSVTIGTDWTDVRGNRPREAYTFIFSTGPTIDSGVIAGRVVADNLQNVIVMCYPDADTLGAQFITKRTKASYIIPVGTSGNFSIRGLSDRRYRIVACRDENKNSLLDPNEDFVMAPRDVDVKAGSASPLLLRLGKAIDHEQPQIARVRAITNTLVSVQFTEPVTPTTAWDSSMRIVSADGKRLQPRVVWTNPTSPDVVYMRFDAPVDSTQYTFELAPASIRDTAEMLNADTTAIRSLTWTTRPDTTQLRIMRMSPADSSRGVGIDTTLQIFFSDAVDTNDVRISIWHQQPQGAIPVTTHWKSPVQLEIAASEPRLPKTWYTTIVIPDRIRSIRGAELSTDSVVHAMLTSTRRAEPGIVRGKLTGFVAPPTGVGAMMRLLTQQGVVVTTTVLDSAGSFTLESIPGEYVVDVYHDMNHNGAFDYGDYQPFRYGEPWWPVITKILVRSRWTLDDVTLDVTPR